MATQRTKEISEFLNGKSAHTHALFDHFVKQFESVGDITLQPARTMIGICNAHRRVAYITQFGKNFIHVVFPFKKAYENNLCFQKIAQVPGDALQFNHHFRMLLPEDVNEEVRGFMKLAFEDELTT